MDAKNLTEASVIAPDIIFKLKSMGRLFVLSLECLKKDIVRLMVAKGKETESYIVMHIICNFTRMDK